MSGRQALERLEVTQGLPAAAYASALEALDADNVRRAPATQIAKALAVLTAVCAKPSDFDDAKVVLWSERLKQVLGEFPAEIALAAVSEWPQAEGGKWWPTEKEVRDECEWRMSFRRWLRHELEVAGAAAVRDAPEPPEPADGMSRNPSGVVARFVNRWNGVNNARAAMYLDGARYGEGVIGSLGLLSQRQIELAVQELGFAESVRVVGPAAISEAGVVEWAL